MKYLAIILVAVLAILIVVFISWFLNMKANGKCPLCALKKIFIPTKLTIDISEDEEYSENKVAQTPPMGWSSWNTFRNNIDQDIIVGLTLYTTVECLGIVALMVVPVERSSVHKS